jgi:hypothetical protein
MDWMGVLAIVLGPGGIIIALIERTRRENNRDHARNTEILMKIDNKIERMDERLDDHIDWHLNNER